MINRENFWHKDLCEIERTFFPEGIVITDLPLSQEPLGSDFQKILNDNLWDLLEDD